MLTSNAAEAAAFIHGRPGLPRIPRAHTSLPTMIIADKAADLIRYTTRTSRHATAGAELPHMATSARDATNQGAQRRAQ